MWLLYRRALAVASVAVFFTAAGEYAFAAGLTPIPPLVWIAVFGAATLPLVLDGRTLPLVLTDPLMRWGALYLCLTVLAFMWSSQSPVALGEMRLRILTVLFLGIQLLVLVDSRVHNAVRVTLLGGVLLGVGLNVIDLLRPLTFTTIVGRAAGLYQNPNISAIALVLGMIMTVELLPRTFRPWFVMLVGVGVLITFSRGGSAAWIVAVVLMVMYGGIRAGAMLRVGIGSVAVAIAALFLAGWWEAAGEALSLMTSGTWERLSVGASVADASAVSRMDDARLAWQMFLERPLTGWGVGATAEWDWFESTHNMFLRHLAEYGIVGLVIMPLLVVAFTGWKSRPEARPVIWLGGVVLTWSVFSHNLLDERHFLICIALAGVLTRREEAPGGVETKPSAPRAVAHGAHA